MDISIQIVDPQNMNVVINEYGSRVVDVSIQDSIVIEVKQVDVDIDVEAVVAVDSEIKEC